MRNWELSIEEYDAIRHQVKQRAGLVFSVEESEIPDGFPYPRTSVCAALATDSVVVGADQELYRCGLQVGEKHRIVQEPLPHQASFFSLPVLNQEDDTEWWKAFNPTELPTCKACSFMPICWGGCPKKHLEMDQHALDEQGKYWRMNLPQMIADRMGVEMTTKKEYEEVDQFREGF